ncbi:MAG: DUF1343 domain-containing protein [Prevotellaceae bacterium]|jgi:uncharacterized protein YbbC (DUF1343 family)|nr:DUF1343 domain-containing protein [Prevotellaceae bacterium]
MKKAILFVLVALWIAVACNNKPSVSQPSKILTGAEQLDEYLPMLEGKTVGVMGNQTSVIDDQHLVDVLLSKGVNIAFAFAPEHGFRGSVTGGIEIDDEVDEKTGLPIFSMYGAHAADSKNEKADSLVASVDIMLFDIQDVGARFYTYITSLHQLMQLCADNNTQLIVLDRPNPNGDQVDGPVRKSDEFKSDVSFHKIAMVHGLTIGELAQMINGEGWLDGSKTCSLHVVTLKNYTHSTLYELPVIPSPSLTNHLSVRLYPSLCLFEATPVSVARGTDFPFQALGYPEESMGDFTFTPEPLEGMTFPLQNGKLCYGIDLRGLTPDSVKFSLKYVLDFYQKSQGSFEFFSRAKRFDQLAGTDRLREQIIAGMTEEQIRDSWKEALAEYKQMRKKYLLYEDFE